MQEHEVGRRDSSVHRLLPPSFPPSIDSSVHSLHRLLFISCFSTQETDIQGVSAENCPDSGKVRSAGRIGRVLQRRGELMGRVSTQ